MSTIRKRQWTNGDGSKGTAYVLGYQDQSGAWVRRQYRTRTEARAEQVRVDAELQRGAHVADRDSLTLASAIDAWLEDYQGLVDAGKRERSTLQRYRELAVHVRAHELASARLSRITPPDVARFAGWLERERTHQQGKRTLDLVRMVMGHGVRVGWGSQNAAECVTLREAGSRHRAPVEVPAKDEIRALLAAAEAHSPRAYALATLLTFCGLRASEARGLRRKDVGQSTVTVEQRADKWGQVGAPKSRTSRRSVPMPPSTRRALAVWLLQSPHSELAFPSQAGTPTSYGNLWNRLWVPLMQAAELVDDAGRPRWGLHALRHTAVSLWIASGANPKQVSAWAGHASVAFTLDVYGHLWADDDAGARAAAAAEAAIFG